MDHWKIAVVRAARAAGVTALLLISGTEGLVGPRSRSQTMRQHFTAEEALKTSGLRWAILRPSAFIQTTMEQIAPYVRDSHRFALPGRDRSFAFVDTQDVGAVAAELLTGDHHWNQIHVLTGPEKLSYADIACLLSETLGERVTYRSQTLFFARLTINQQIHHYHARNQAADLAALLLGGFDDRPTDTVASLFGRPPRSVQQWVEANVDLFRD